MTRRTALHRARQFARSSPLHTEVFDFILGEEARVLLEAAVDARQAPVGAISRSLVQRFGQENFSSTAARQFVGMSVAARLEALNIIPDGTRVRLRGDPIFNSGTLFRRAVDSPNSSTEELLARFVNSLTDEEVRTVAALIDRRHSLSKLSSADGQDFDKEARSPKRA